MNMGSEELKEQNFIDYTTDSTVHCCTTLEDSSTVITHANAVPKSLITNKNCNPVLLLLSNVASSIVVDDTHRMDIPGQCNSMLNREHRGRYIALLQKT